jgi:hypothetical protein
MTPSKTPALAVLIAWALVSLSAAWVMLGYADIPDPLPVYRSLLGEPIVLAHKTPITVFRLPAMGVGQLGAATVMSVEARQAHAAGWSCFWRAAALTAGAKTLVECGALLAPPAANLALTLATYAVVMSFLLAAAVLWRRGVLSGVPRLRPGAWSILVASLGLWLGGAISPRWLA